MHQVAIALRGLIIISCYIGGRGLSYLVSPRGFCYLQGVFPTNVLAPTQSAGG